MGLGRGYAGQDCSLARALEVVGERWTLLVLRDCFYGVTQFGDFQVHLDIPRAVLTERLKTLTGSGVLERHAHAGVVHYLLTEQGRELWPTVFALTQWGERWSAPEEGARRSFSHAACDAELDSTGWCPGCGSRPAPDELITREGPGAGEVVRTDRVSAALRAGPHRMLTPLFPEPGYTGSTPAEGSAT
ncbi:MULTISPECIES: helix-turn-helix domain-containing protein [unclassified Actinopolyspora]|uniref:winged helix-turn-helix transcriptional regulator n=1 Tax=unclassified Actinopolyspora TaxID=2639451 RepID=UPI0013F59890|nr:MULTISPECIES: helix-turn-helix domain-containing protein [unclassified Actinopolyspora]NHD15958.1 helix-turn-helix transcriptional regulator [Actinopolyspora sp. BKK2]NHE74828.1 helix-turn-helix transcriptional regulator [Actinopolyspora sp. BKK1]